jgi:hypothetical protein
MLPPDPFTRNPGETMTDFHGVDVQGVEFQSISDEVRAIRNAALERLWASWDFKDAVSDVVTSNGRGVSVTLECLANSAWECGWDSSATRYAAMADDLIKGADALEEKCKSPAFIAQCFCEMNSDKQAEFFNVVGALSCQWEYSPLVQWRLMRKDLNVDGRLVIDNIKGHDDPDDQSKEKAAKITDAICDGIKDGLSACFSEDVDRVVLAQRDEHTTLCRDPKSGIAWVEDGRAGVVHTCHPNVSDLANSDDAYGPGANVRRSHGWLYHVDVCIVSDELDELARQNCQCGGTHTLYLR